MRRAAARTLACLAALPPLLAAGRAAASPAGEVDSVVVFADRARVTRLRAVRCEHGVAQAAFDRLPWTLDPRTLRGDVLEAADVIGLGADVVHEEESSEVRAKAIVDRQHKLDADIRTNQARQAAVSDELEDVTAYAGLFAGTVNEEMRNPHPGTAAWGESLDALRARRAALEDEGRKLVVAMRALRLEEAKLARQLRDVGGEPKSYRTATVTVGCRALHEVTAALSYVVPGATWQPEYDLDFAPRGHAKVGPGTARLTVGAVIRQATGEDWRGARLSLSTARPKLGTEAPRPAPLLVDGYEQQRDKVMVQALERRDRLEAGGPAGGAGPAAAALDDKGNAFVLTLPIRWSP
jgi:uncharacterized protein (TIGR02231 family)